eukprot:XP_011682721.1 PREDICTED: uncharacterized protein LOC105446954 [Strongylocentrotus purpuratus]
MISSLLRSLNIATVQVVTALFIQTCFVLGTVKSIGVFFYEFQDTLGTTSSDIGISLGLFNAFTFGPGPMVAHIYRHGKLRRPLLLTGAILAPLGLILSSIITNNIQLAVCLSLGGLGGNILSQCLVTCLEAHAHDHFYALFGISRSGYAFGMLISPLLAAYLMDIYGWRGAMLIMGAITCNLIPLTVMVDTNIHDKSENVATSDSVKYHNHSEEISINDRDRSSLKECSSMVTNNGLNNDATVGSENESILRHTEHCQGLISGTVQDECDEMQETSLQQYKEPLGDRCPTTTTTASEQDKGDLCSESCSLMEINDNLQSPTHGRHQQGVNDLSSSGTDHPSADTTSKLSLKRIRRTLMDSVYNQDRCLMSSWLQLPLLPGTWRMACFLYTSSHQSRKVSLLDALSFILHIYCVFSFAYLHRRHSNFKTGFWLRPLPSPEASQHCLDACRYLLCQLRRHDRYVIYYVICHQ